MKSCSLCNFNTAYTMNKHQIMTMCTNNKFGRFEMTCPNHDDERLHKAVTTIVPIMGLDYNDTFFIMKKLISLIEIKKRDIDNEGARYDVPIGIVILVNKTNKLQLQTFMKSHRVQAMQLFIIIAFVSLVAVDDYVGYYQKAFKNEYSQIDNAEKTIFEDIYIAFLALIEFKILITDQSIEKQWKNMQTPLTTIRKQFEVNSKQEEHQTLTKSEINFLCYEEIFESNQLQYSFSNTTPLEIKQC